MELAVSSISMNERIGNNKERVREKEGGREGEGGRRGGGGGEVGGWVRVGGGREERGEGNEGGGRGRGERYIVNPPGNLPGYDPFSCDPEVSCQTPGNFDAAVCVK